MLSPRTPKARPVWRLLGDPCPSITAACPRRTATPSAWTTFTTRRATTTRWTFWISATAPLEWERWCSAGCSVPFASSTKVKLTGRSWQSTPRSAANSRRRLRSKTSTGSPRAACPSASSGSTISSRAAGRARRSCTSIYMARTRPSGSSSATSRRGESSSAARTPAAAPRGTGSAQRNPRPTRRRCSCCCLSTRPLARSPAASCRLPLRWRAPRCARLSPPWPWSIRMRRRLGSVR
mmetsp:Transcript_51349/g.156070  ORF Transcript_51349/g.156070 Transcript_51349/m.156070 type:complete len:237 (+) Transcript_51349:159-869(+)